MKIIWAVDAFGSEQRQLKVSTFLAPIVEKLKAEVEPVFVMSLSGIPGTIDRQGILMYLPRAEEGLRKLISKSKLSHLLPEKIIIQTDAAYIRNDVKALLSYAKKNKAQAIVVSTHAKKGVPRLFLGSFAETLLLHSQIPVISINPSTKPKWNTRSIMFVTDFSSESKHAFHSLILYAKKLNAKITLFHLHTGVKEDLEKNVLTANAKNWKSAQNLLLETSLTKAKKSAISWQKEAKSQGVSCTLAFEYGLQNVAEAAVKKASELNIEMIALASIKGPVASGIIGSTTRWLVRSAHCPVWVLHVNS